jgi:hypothetical protein
MSRIGRRVMFSIAATVVAAASAEAQDAEPRLYANTPVGLNFLIAGYVYSQGKLAFDPSLSVAMHSSMRIPVRWPMSGRSS